MKLDLGKILKSINKGERPSSDTLYVSSKNDPRLRTYQDSLNLYKFAGSNNPSELKKLTESYYRLKEKNKQAPKATKSDKLGNITINEVYKKPVKTVVYKDTEAKKVERPVVNKKPNIDTLFVPSKNDPRLRAYQDSLGLYNDARKYYDVTIEGDYKRFGSRPVLFGKGNSLASALSTLHFQGQDYDIPKKYLKFYSKEHIEQLNRIQKISKKTSSSKINPIGTYPIEGFAPAYKKPERPVVYRRPEPDNQDIEEIKQEVLQAIQNKYEGAPVYSSTAGSGGPSALVGFENKGDTTFIRPEDLDRFAVPKYARQFIQSKSKKK
jgi:hypothetical protein